MRGLRYPIQIYASTAIIAILLIGCDTGRVGMHKVKFDLATPTGVSQTEKLKQLISNALAGQGFEEKPGIPHIWRKRGTTVEVYEDLSGDLILKVGAFGSKRDVRVSERTEREIIDLLMNQQGITLTPTSPPKATIE